MFCSWQQRVKNSLKHADLLCQICLKINVEKNTNSSRVAVHMKSKGGKRVFSVLYVSNESLKFSLKGKATS